MLMQPWLQHFHPIEFVNDGRDWYELMSSRQMVCMDIGRELWGRPWWISEAPGALGRYLGDSLSQHNVTKWRECRAADIYADGVEVEDDALRLVQCATDAGFTGVGLYIGYPRGVLLHVDTRVDARMGRPATWGCRVTIRPDGTVHKDYSLSLRDAVELI